MSDGVDPGFDQFEVDSVECGGTTPDFESFVIERDDGAAGKYRATVEVDPESRDAVWWSDRPIERPFEATVRVESGQRYRVALHIGLSEAGEEWSVYEGNVEFLEEREA